MVQFIGDDGIFGAKKGFKSAAVGVEAGAVKDGVLGAEELAEAGFQFLVGGLGAADEADGGQAVAPLVQAVVGGLDDERMAGQAEIIVGAEVQDRRARPHADSARLAGW